MGFGFATPGVRAQTCAGGGDFRAAGAAATRPRGHGQVVFSRGRPGPVAAIRMRGRVARRSRQELPHPRTGAGVARTASRTARTSTHPPRVRGRVCAFQSFAVWQSAHGRRAPAPGRDLAGGGPGAGAADGQGRGRRCAVGSRAGPVPAQGGAWFVSAGEAPRLGAVFRPGWQGRRAPVDAGRRFAGAAARKRFQATCRLGLGRDRRPLPGVMAPRPWIFPGSLRKSRLGWNSLLTLIFNFN